MSHASAQRILQNVLESTSTPHEVADDHLVVAGKYVLVRHVFASVEHRLTVPESWLRCDVLVLYLAQSRLLVRVAPEALKSFPQPFVLGDLPVGLAFTEHVRVPQLLWHLRPE